MKKTLLSIISVALLSGCIGSQGRMVQFAATDMGYWEYQFVANLAHGFDVVTTCNQELDWGYDLSAAQARLNQSMPNGMLYHAGSDVRSSFVSEGECTTWSDRISEWEKSGSMPLIGGSVEDPKWFK
ncbi:hypothetical protein NTE12_005124 [Vibrio harveyi]|nr:hypothetical protein [Vibrio harveyi]